MYCGQLKNKKLIPWSFMLWLTKKQKANNWVIHIMVSLASRHLFFDPWLSFRTLCCDHPRGVSTIKCKCIMNTVIFFLSLYLWLAVFSPCLFHHFWPILFNCQLLMHTHTHTSTHIHAHTHTVTHPCMHTHTQTQWPLGNLRCIKLTACLVCGGRGQRCTFTNHLPAKMTRSASLRASRLCCLTWISLWRPSRPRDMPPRKHGIPKACFKRKKERSHFTIYNWKVFTEFQC